MSPPAHASSAGQVGDPRPLHTVASSSTHDGMDSIQTGKWFPTPVASSAARAALVEPPAHRRMHAGRSVGYRFAGRPIIQYRVELHWAWAGWIWTGIKTIYTFI
jgi:hypothetical protein